MCGNFSRMKRMKRYANQLYSGRDFAQVLLPTSSCRKENSSRQLTNIYFFHKKKISKIVHLFQNHNYDEAGKYYGLILTGINKKSWPIGSYQKFFAKKCPKCIKIIQIIIKNKISKDTTNWALEIDFTEKLSMLRPWTWVYVGLSNIAWPCLTIKTPFAIFSIESRSDRGTVVKGDSLLHGSGVDLASLTRKKKVLCPISEYWRPISSLSEVFLTAQPATEAARGVFLIGKLKATYLELHFLDARS